MWITGFMSIGIRSLILDFGRPHHEQVVLQHLRQNDFETVIKYSVIHLHAEQYKVYFSFTDPFDGLIPNSLGTMAAILSVRKVHRFTMRAAKCVICWIHDIRYPLFIVFVKNTTISVYLIFNNHYNICIFALNSGSP